MLSEVIDFSLVKYTFKKSTLGKNSNLSLRGQNRR